MESVLEAVAASRRGARAGAAAGKGSREPVEQEGGTGSWSEFGETSWAKVAIEELKSGEVAAGTELGSSRNEEVDPGFAEFDVEKLELAMEGLRREARAFQECFEMELKPQIGERHVDRSGSEELVRLTKKYGEFTDFARRIGLAAENPS